MNRRTHAKNTLNILAYYQRKDALIGHRARYLNDWAGAIKAGRQSVYWRSHFTVQPGLEPKPVDWSARIAVGVSLLAMAYTMAQVIRWIIS